MKNITALKTVQSCVAGLFFTAMLMISCARPCFSQGVGINDAGAPADSSALLDVSGTDKGVLIPRMTIAQRNAIIKPATGLLIYVTDCSNFQYNAGTPQTPNWLLLGMLNALPAPGPVNGPAAVCPYQTGVNYSIPPVTGATTYNWTVPQGTTITSGQGTNSITVNIDTTAGSICVTAANQCSSTNPLCVTITFNGSPSVTSHPAPVTICENGNATFSITASGMGLTYQWQENNGGWYDLSNGGYYSNVTTTTLNITGTPASLNGRQYRCIASGPCPPYADTSNAALLTVNAIPSSAFTWSPLNPDIGQNCTFSPAVTGATYNWTFQNGNPLVSPAQNPVVMWSSNGTYNVALVVTQNGCSSSVTTQQVTVTNCVPGSTTFAYTGSQQTWTVPGCVTSINVDVRGAKGGNGPGGGAGGLGGRVQATLAVSPGDILYIYVGGAGIDDNNGSINHAGGYNGGGMAYADAGYSQYGGGSGGGASDIRVNGTALGNRKIVAGGGGGAGADGCTAGPLPGGAGGGTTGGSGGSGNLCNCNPSGQGGTQAAGGAKGDWGCTCDATAGSLGQGGNSNSTSCGGPTAGGGGGGGYYGGGGGGLGGGGGGSSYTDPGATGVIHTQGYQSGNGVVIISW